VREGREKREMKEKREGRQVRHKFSHEMANSLISFFKNCSRTKVVLMGMGNELRGDDGLGSYLARSLKGKVSAAVLDCGEVPESYTDKIKDENPETISIIDALDFGAQPGSLGIFKPEDIKDEPRISTHKLPFKVLAQYLKEETKAEIILIGVQPKNIGFGEKMSEEVTQSANLLVDLLSKLMP